MSALDPLNDKNKYGEKKKERRKWTQNEGRKERDCCIQQKWM